MSDTTYGTEQEGTVEHFHSISSIRYAGFTEANMSQLEKILQAYRSKPQAQAMLNFFTTLREHILDRTAHGISVDDYDEQLITQLYHSYRDLGYTGTRKDMLMAIAKDIEIGTVEECLAGYITTKAVNTVGWKAMFDEHSSDPQAHKLFFDSLLPDDALNVDPDFHLDAFFGEQNYLIEDEGYTITSWNIYSGTLYLSFSYNLTDVTSDPNLVIMQLDFVKFKIRFELACNWSDANDEEIKIVIWKTYNDSSVEDQLLGALKCAFATKGYDRLIVVTDHSDATIRTMLDTVTLHYDIYDEQQPYCLEVYVPIQYDADTDNRAVIKEVSHYPVAASTTEQLFFLN